MRLHIGLPGPFSVSTGGRRGKPSPIGALIWIVFIVGVLIAAVKTYPGLAIILAIVAVFVVIARRPRRVRRSTSVTAPPVRRGPLPTYESVQAQKAPVDLPSEAPRQVVAPDDPGPKLWVPRNYLDNS